MWSEWPAGVPRIRSGAARAASLKFAQAFAFRHAPHTREGDDDGGTRWRDGPTQTKFEPSRPPR